MTHRSRSELVAVPETSEPYLAAMEAAGAKVEEWVADLPEGSEIVRRDVSAKSHWTAQAILYWSEPG